MIEETTDDPVEHTVLISMVLEAGQFVRFPGDDVAVGQLLVDAGCVVTGAPLLASIFRTTSWKPSGIESWYFLGLTGSAVRILVSVSTSEVPSNGAWPVSRA